jgi:hypothetical protein
MVFKKTLGNRKAVLECALSQFLSHQTKPKMDIWGPPVDFAP